MTDDALREAAASWVLLHQFEEMTDARRAAFDDWLSSNPEARQEYRHVERMWRLAADPAVDTGGTTPRSIYRGGPPRRRYPGRWIAGALAASLVLTFGAAPHRIARYVDVQLAPMRGGGQILATTDRQRSARLADGTIVTLDAGTRLRVLEMGARRRVDLLQGHAFFQVAKDAQHPFLVTAMDKTVRALGTAFDVRVEPDAVAVTLVEGRVRVDEPRGLLRAPIATEMTPGKRLVASSDQVWMITPVDTTAATRWFKDRLAYNEETVATIVADVNAGSERKIMFVGPVNQDQRLVGVFARGDVDTLATVLELKGIAHVISRAGNRIEMSSRVTTTPTKEAESKP